jgi:hypothetical protein
MLLDKSLNTKKNYIKSIIAFIHTKQKKAREIYSASLASIQGEINKKIDKQEKNEGVVYKTPDELNENTDEFLENGEIQNALLSVFYTGFYMPVCRVKEIYTLKIRNYNINNDNYIDLIDKCFVFNNFKTSKIYGKQKVLFNDFIYNIIEQLADTHDKDFLFINNKKEPYSQTDMSTKIKNTIGYSVNDLRSMYFTHHSQLGNLNTEIQKQKFAVLMRNSPSVFKYYIKY